MTLPEAAPQRWSADTISNENYRAGFVTVPATVQYWMSSHGGLERKQVLDFGCGYGTAALGLALKNPRATVVGMDIVPDPLRCGQLAREQIGLDELPKNLSLHQVRVGAMPDPAARFDLVYAWSVFEHVNQELLVGVLRQIHDVLRPGGKIIIQMNPLFYSAIGSHLDPWIPGPWSHLIDQDSTYRGKMLEGAKGDKNLYEALVRLYGTLNRLTVKDFYLLLDQTGFAVILDKYQIDQREIPSPLLNVYRENVLREQGIAVLAERRMDRPS